MIKSRIAAIAAISLAVLLLIGFLIWVGSSTVTVTLINESEHEIKRGRIVEFGHIHAFERIPIGSSRRIAFSPHGEGGFVVEVEFESGGVLASVEKGYVTPGMDMDVRVRVLSGDIWFD